MNSYKIRVFSEKKLWQLERSNKMELLFLPLRLALLSSGALVLGYHSRARGSQRSTKNDQINKRRFISAFPSDANIQTCTLVQWNIRKCSSVVFFESWPNLQLCNVFMYQMTTFMLCILACVLYLITSLSSLLVRVLFLSFLRIQLKANLFLLTIDASSFNFQIINQVMIIVYRISLTSFVASAVLLVLLITWHLHNKFFNVADSFAFCSFSNNNASRFKQLNKARF